MAPLAPNLDNLRFQKDLVDEARRRIIRYCPEWTDYNISDPGITLIELFAFMAESMIYRMNRVPERNYLKFLEMMGLHPLPASSAHAELTFYLSVPFPLNPDDELQAIVPQGLEVTTRQMEGEPEIIFSVDKRMVLTAPHLVQLRRDVDFNKNYLPRLGIETFHAFNPNGPKPGDTFYLGFDENQDISGYILRLTFDCEESLAVGVRRSDPPWVWECSLGENRWQEVPVSSRKGEKDSTGGLNNPHGTLVLHLPQEITQDLVHGRRAYWLRCRLEQRAPEQGMYTESPRVTHLEAHTLGGKTWATHATAKHDEVLGQSIGEPGQTFRVQHAPVLTLRTGEAVEVEERVGSEIGYVPWTQVKDFANSDQYDRVYTLDEASGTITFGPGIRQPDGTIHQYGRVPEAGRKVRISQYRFGGGGAGNVPAEKIQVLRSGVPFIDRVINFIRAEGGRDQESLEELQMRAQRDMRSQQRAVTAEDFENLARNANRSVARVKCNGAVRAGKGQAPGVVELLVVPAAFDAIRLGDLSKLVLDSVVLTQIRNYIDQYRLIATIVNIRAPNYLGIKVQAEVAATPFSSPEQVAMRVKERLAAYLSPLKIWAPDQPDELFGPVWEGWPFGRELFVAELFSLLQAVPGVKHVLDVKISYRPILLGQMKLTETGGNPEGGENALTPLTQRMLSIPQDTLLCSLDHEVEVVEL